MSTMSRLNTRHGVEIASDPTDLTSSTSEQPRQHQRKNNAESEEENECYDGGFKCRPLDSASVREMMAVLLRRDQVGHESCQCSEYCAHEDDYDSFRLHSVSLDPRPTL